MLTTYTLRDKKIIETMDGEAKIFVYLNPTDDEKKRLLTEFMLDEHTLNSALDPDEPARFEIEPSHAAVIFKRPKNYSGKDRFLFKVNSMGLFLFQEKLIIVSTEEVPVFIGKTFASVDGVHELALKVLWASIHHYLEHLKIINQITDEIERLISIAMENKYLLNLFSLEKSLVYYLSAINANGYVLEKLRAAAPKINFSVTATEFMDDLVIENTQCYRQAEIYSNILASLMDARVSIVSNNLNILMKTLNLVTIVIMVPTLVVSFFSMNVTLPFESHPMAFVIVLVLSGLSVAAVMVWWKNLSAKLRKGERGA